MSIATDNMINLLVIAALVKKLGGEAVVSQHDLDCVSLERLLECSREEEDGTFSIILRNDARMPRA